MDQLVVKNIILDDDSIYARGCSFRWSFQEAHEVRIADLSYITVDNEGEPLSVAAPHDLVAFFNGVDYSLHSLTRREMVDQDASQSRGSAPPEIWVDQAQFKAFATAQGVSSPVHLRLLLQERDEDEQILQGDEVAPIDLLVTFDDKRPLSFSTQVLRPHIQGKELAQPFQFPNDLPRLKDGIFPLAELVIYAMDASQKLADNLLVQLVPADGLSDSQNKIARQLLPFLVLQTGSLLRTAIFQQARSAEQVSQSLEPSVDHTKVAAQFFDITPTHSFGQSGDPHEARGWQLGLNLPLDHPLWREVLNVFQRKQGNQPWYTFDLFDDRGHLMASAKPVSFSMIVSLEPALLFTHTGLANHVDVMPLEATQNHCLRQKIEEHPVKLGVSNVDNADGQISGAFSLGLYWPKPKPLVHLEEARQASFDQGEVSCFWRSEIDEVVLKPSASSFRFLSGSSLLWDWQVIQFSSPMVEAIINVLLSLCEGHIEAQKIPFEIEILASQQKTLSIGIGARMIAMASQDGNEAPKAVPVGQFVDAKQPFCLPSTLTLTGAPRKHGQSSLRSDELISAGHDIAAVPDRMSLTQLKEQKANPSKRSDTSLYQYHFTMGYDGGVAPNLEGLTYHNLQSLFEPGTFDHQLDQSQLKLTGYYVSFYDQASRTLGASDEIESMQLAKDCTHELLSFYGASVTSPKHSPETQEKALTPVKRLVFVSSFPSYRNHHRRFYAAGFYGLHSLCYGPFAALAQDLDRAALGIDDINPSRVEIVPTAVAGAQYFIDEQAKQKTDLSWGRHLHIHMGDAETQIAMLHFQRIGARASISKISHNFALGICETDFDLVLIKLIEVYVNEAIAQGVALAWKVTDFPKGSAKIRQVWCGVANEHDTHSHSLSLPFWRAFFKKVNDFKQKIKRGLELLPIKDGQTSRASLTLWSHQGHQRDSICELSKLDQLPIHWRSADGLAELIETGGKNGQERTVALTLDIAQLFHKGAHGGHGLLALWGLICTILKREMDLGNRVENAERTDWSWSLSGEQRLFPPLEACAERLFGVAKRVQPKADNAPMVQLALGAASFGAKPALIRPKNLGRALVLVAFQDGSDPKAIFQPFAQRVEAVPLKFFPIASEGAKGHLPTNTKRISLLSMMPGLAEPWLFMKPVPGLKKPITHQFMEAWNLYADGQETGFDPQNSAPMWEEIFADLYKIHMDETWMEKDQKGAGDNHWGFEWLDFGRGVLTLGVQTFIVDGLQM